MKHKLTIFAILSILVINFGCRETPKEEKKQYIERGRILNVVPATEYWSTRDLGSGDKELKNIKSATEAARAAKIKGDAAFTGREVIERRKIEGLKEEYKRIQSRKVDIEEAARYYIRAYNLGWNDYLLVFRIGWCMQKSDPTKAMKYFRIANEMYKQKHDGKEFVDAIFNEACCLMLLSRYLDERYYTKEPTEISHKLFKDSDGGNGSTKADEIKVREGAITVLSRVINLDKDYRLAYYNRSISYYNVGFYRDSYNDLKKFLDISRKPDEYTKYGRELSLQLKKELRIKTD